MKDLVAEELRAKWSWVVPYTSPTGVKTSLHSRNTIAELLGRHPHKIRCWELQGILPKTPFRYHRRRMYSNEHVLAIVECAERAGICPGSGKRYRAFGKYLHIEFKKINEKFFGKKDEVKNAEEERKQCSKHKKDRVSKRISSKTV